MDGNFPQINRLLVDLCWSISINREIDVALKYFGLSARCVASLGGNLNCKDVNLSWVRAICFYSR